MRESRNGNEQIREEVRRAYSSAAQHPENGHAFPLGRHFAESIGYPPNLLASLPSVSMDTFTGVSNVSLFADIPAGSVVLDLGCGAGLDSLIAAGRVGSGGRVVGVDFSEAMLARARQAAAQCKVINVEFRQADAEELPIEAETIDVALVNGIFNLNPDRNAIIRELGRVLREGGVVYAAELILTEPLPPAMCESQSDWFA